MSKDVLRRALVEIRELKAKVDQLERERSAASEPVAIVGLGCRFPGAADPDAFWALLESGGDAISDVPAGRWDTSAYFDPDPEAEGKMYTQRGGYLPRVDGFDAAFFGVSPREAENLDPQHRLLLEVAWEAMEHGGIAPSTLRGSNTGVFVGICSTDYQQIGVATSDASRIDAYALTGNAPNAAAGRLSFTFGLEGPSMAVDTACSSSLTALHLARTALSRGECDLALVGGVNLLLSPFMTIGFSKLRAISPSGRCRTFDAGADGFVRGEGCGVVVLERLGDARSHRRRVIAVLRGSAVGQDGRSSGLTVPNGPAQSAVIERALREADTEPDQVSYVEAHGTATPLGDPIELNALGRVFGPAPLHVGSVKTNIGHLEGAAGIAGVIKTALSIERGVIPPQLHFETPNPNAAWAGHRISVPTAPVPWPSPRVAGVSAFGFSGTNAHVVLSEPDVPAEAQLPDPRGVDDSAPLFVFSGRTPTAVRSLAERTAGSEAPWADVAACTRRRDALPWRASVVAATPDALREAAGRLEPAEVSRVRGPVFVFAGQGLQQPGMGRSLHRNEPVFRDAVDRCCEALGRRMEDVLLDGDAIHRTEHTQPALFVLEYATAELLCSWGVRPSAVIGHSVGEIAAACVAGGMPVEQAVRFVAARATAMQALPPGGGMRALDLDADAAQARLRGTLAIAAINAPTKVVVSGAIDDLDAVFGDEGTALRVSHAFHSPLIEPAADALLAQASKLDLSPPTIPIACNVTGAIDDVIATCEYWRRHALEPVRFADGLRSLADYDVFVGIGPASSLLALGQMVLDDRRWLRSMRRDADEREAVGELAGALFCAGVDVDWDAHDGGPYRPVTLPPYPWERRKYWSVDGPVRPRRQEVAVDTLEGARLVSPLDAIEYERPLRADDPVVADHLLFGIPVVAAATQLAMLHRAATRERGACDLLDVRFETPLVVPEDGARTARVVLEGDRARLVSRADSDDVWHTHARATLGQSGAQVPSDGGLEQSDALASDAFYRALDARGYALGPSFRALGDIRHAPGCAEAPLTVDSRGPLEPGVIDAALQLLTATADADRMPLLVPVSIARFSAREATGSLTARARLETSGGATHGDVALHDSNGAAVLIVQGMRALPTDAEALQAKLHNARSPAAPMYEVTWIDADPEPAPAPDVHRRWSIEGGDELGRALCAALERRGDLCRPESGSTDTPTHRVRILSEAPLLAAFDAVQRSIAEQVPLTLVADDVDPRHAMAAALARVLGREAPSSLGRVVSTQLASSNAERLAEPLADAVRSSHRQVRIKQPKAQVPRLSPLRLDTPPFTPRADRSYLVTGAFGALGRQVVAWLVSSSAEVLALGRNPSAVEGARSVACDVTDPAALEHTLALAERPLAGVFHLAGALDDGVLSTFTAERLEAAVAAKVEGAKSLDRLTSELDAFVCFSSAAATLGAPGQGAYAAANAYLDALCIARRHRGLAATSVAFGPWQGDGMAAATRIHPAVRPLAAPAALLAMRTLMSARLPHALVIDADWSALAGPTVPELLEGIVPRDATTRTDADPRIEGLVKLDAEARRRTLVDVLQDEAKAVMRLDEHLDPARPLNELGLDSLMGVELTQRLAAATALDLPATTLFDYPTLDALADHLEQRLAPDDAADTVVDARETEVAAMDDADAEAALLASLDALEGED